jgi:hypothetical protein
MEVKERSIKMYKSINLIITGDHMRKYALLKEEINDICKVMIYQLQEETYVFLYNTKMDAPCFADLCFDQLEDAEEYCKRELGVY